MPLQEMLQADRRVELLSCRHRNPTLSAGGAQTPTACQPIPSAQRCALAAKPRCVHNPARNITNKHIWRLFIYVARRTYAASSSYQRRTRSARSVFQRLGLLSPSSSSKCTLPLCVFSSSQEPSGCCLDRSRWIASFRRRSGVVPTERKYSSARRTS